jgi:hypothetical protein
VVAIVSAMLALAAMAGLAASAQAATYTVGTKEDLTGTCANPASGTCSLRQLIEYEDALETTPSPPDIIVVPEGEYTLINRALEITKSLVILGAGARTTTVDVSTQAPERVFNLELPTEESSVGIFGLKIAGGTARADEFDGTFGGDINNKTGVLLLSEDWITEGTASAGGGISNDFGTVVLERSLVSGNHASSGSGETSGIAGGIQNYGSASCDSVCSPGKRAVLAVEDSTVAGNDARLGGGIFSLAEDGVADENVVSIINSTIAYNKAEEEPSCVEFCTSGPGAGLRASTGTIEAAGSIVAFNTETTSGKTTNTNCALTSTATILSFGYNLETETDCGFKSTGDLQSASPDFSSSSPQNNGGSTNTLAPEPASPAVDAIPTSFEFCEGLDQRGITRPQGAGCDIGAVELAPSTFQATGIPVSATAGTQFSGTVATFTEAVPDTVASDYTATINWGDGTATAGTVSAASGGGFAVSGSHTYANGGAYTISVTITDVQGATATATSTATVTATPPPPAPPTVVTTSLPSVITTTSAVFTTTVNPHGLATTVHFEYGPVLEGASAAAASPITYSSVTPNQTVGPDFANHTVTATVTGLLPNVTYNVRAVATNSAGNAIGANQTVVTPADPPPPPPVLGKNVNVTPVSGIVYIELPPGATLASAASVSPFSSFSAGAQAVESLTKGQSFIPLTEARQIPVGSILETTHGVVGITTATTASRKGKLQSGDFGSGIFKLLQGRKQKGLTELDIINNFKANQVCTTLGKKARIASRHLSSKVLGQLNSSGHGHFTARGQDSAATVRGTVWSVKNQCDGTLTHVKRGVVSVRDFIRRKTITLFTGQSYLARGPRR